MTLPGVDTAITEALVKVSLHAVKGHLQAATYDLAFAQELATTLDAQLGADIGRVLVAIERAQNILVEKLP